jgi:hypothetical protein
MTFTELLKNIQTLQKSLNNTQNEDLLHYPQYIGYLLKNKADYLNSKKSEIYTKTYQKLMIEYFKNIYEKYRYEKDVDEIQVALKAVEELSPYLKEQPLEDSEPFRLILDDLIDRGMILELLGDGLCSQKTQNNFAVFGKDNIYNVILLKQNYPSVYQELISKDDNLQSIFSLFYVANALETLSIKEQEVFLTLLKELPGESIYLKIPFIHRLEKIGYLRKIINIVDYNKYVSASNNDLSGKSTVKYVYILLTSYPSQNDLSIIQRYYNSKFDDKKIRKYLYELKKTPIDELETHRFTFADKAELYIDVADYTLMAASIAVLPFTGGASLSYISTSITRKVSTKSLKYAIKKSIKSINNTIKFGKNIKRSIVNKFGERKLKVVGKKIEGSADTVDNTSDLFFMGSFLLKKSPIEMKNICEEIR